jgi:hypothetical protein
MSTSYNNKKIIKKRIRDDNNNPIGMIVALNKNQLGWSLCNVEHGDKYDDDLALLKAIKRAESDENSNYAFWNKCFYRIKKRQLDYGNYSVLKTDIVNSELHFLQDRANKYFKDEIK